MEPKEKSIFEESRPEMFRAFYRTNLDEIASRVGRRTSDGRWKWTGGATRRRVRELARQQARLEMRNFRREQREAA